MHRAKRALLANAKSLADVGGNREQAGVAHAGLGELGGRARPFPETLAGSGEGGFSGLITSHARHEFKYRSQPDRVPTRQSVADSDTLMHVATPLHLTSESAPTSSARLAAGDRADSAQPRLADGSSWRVEDPASASGRVSLFDFQPDWGPALVKLRWVIAVLWLAVHAVSFNGQWRIGLDSAIYRHVGRSLANGEGYRIFGETQTLVYPGYPLLLGGLDYLFGELAWPGIVAGLLFNAGAIWLTWRLMQRVLPAWAAVLVSLGVAMNWTLVQQGHEHMTDGPFFFAVVLSLYGWERLMQPTLDPAKPRSRWPGGVWLTIGLVLAAAFRPTFWVLVGAWVVVGGIALLRATFTHGVSRKRAFQVGLPMLLAVLVAVLFVWLDPRTSGLDPTGGVYEAEVAARAFDVGGLLSALPAKLWEIFNDDLPRLFFAERVHILNAVFSVAIVAGVIMVGRRRPLWAAMVGMLLVAMVVANTESRYYLMVLPILWAGWLWFAVATANIFKGIRWRSFIVGALAVLVLVGNAIHIGKFIVEQRGDPFLEHYKDGSYIPVVAAADVVRENVPEGDVVIGPYARILSYLGQRKVLGRRELGMGYVRSDIDRLLAVAEADADWLLFPGEAYRRKDKEILVVMDHGWILPGNDPGDPSFPIGHFDERDWYIAPYVFAWWELSDEDRAKLEAVLGRSFLPGPSGEVRP